MIFSCHKIAITVKLFLRQFMVEKTLLEIYTCRHARVVI